MINTMEITCKRNGGAGTFRAPLVEDRGGYWSLSKRVEVDVSTYDRNACEGSTHACSTTSFIGATEGRGCSEANNEPTSWHKSSLQI